MSQADAAKALTKIAWRPLFERQSLASATILASLTCRKLENPSFRRAIEKLAGMNLETRADAKLEQPKANTGASWIPETVLFAFLKEEESAGFPDELASRMPHGWRSL